jgi:hypothetical protein
MPDAATRIDREHKQIIGALRRFDLERLIQLCDAHRIGGHEGIGVTRSQLTPPMTLSMTSPMTLPVRGRDVAG